MPFLLLRRLSALVRLLALPAAACVLGWAASTPWAAVHRPGPASVDDLIAVGAAGGAAALLTGLTTVTAVTLLGAATGRTEQAWARLAGRLTPVALRRVGEVALGLVLVGTPTAASPALAAAGPALATAAPALAASAPPAPAVSATVSPARIPGVGRPVAARPSVDRPAPPAAGSRQPSQREHRGWLPERPSTIRRAALPPVRLVAAAPRLDRARRSTVVVRRGDSLWRIAHRYLGPGTSAAAVAAEWPRWYAANRAVIGPDPALLRPGQQLRPPAPDDSP